VAILLGMNVEDILEAVDDILQSNYCCMDLIVWSLPCNYGPLVGPSLLPKRDQNYTFVFTTAILKCTSKFLK
jgi:hypothetical protein